MRSTCGRRACGARDCPSAAAPTSLRGFSRDTYVCGRRLRHTKCVTPAPRRASKTKAPTAPPIAGPATLPLPPPFPGAPEGSGSKASEPAVLLALLGAWAEPLPRAPTDPGAWDGASPPAGAEPPDVVAVLASVPELTNHKTLGIGNRMNTLQSRPGKIQNRSTQSAGAHDNARARAHVYTQQGSRFLWQGERVKIYAELRPSCGLDARNALEAASSTT